MSRKLATVTLTVIGLLLLVAFFKGFDQFQPLMDLQGRNQTHVESESVVTSHRKLLEHRGGGGSAKVEPNRVWGDKCTKSDIVVNQGSTTPMPNGIPTYTVEIMNVCSNGCEISNIHLSCGWFSSARMINPKVFKRVRFDDCIVNNGNPLVNGGTLSFQYANTFRYPLSVSYVKC